MFGIVGESIFFGFEGLINIEKTFNRLKESVCTAEGSIVYSTLLINFERIGDHLLNIAEDIQNTKKRHIARLN